MTKNELIEKLQAIEGNPDIAFAVDCQIVCSDEYNYWYGHSVEKVEKLMLYEIDDRYADIEDVKNELDCRFWDTSKTDEENEKVIDEEFDKLNKYEMVEIRISV